MIFFFSIFFILYGALNYYIFIRGWEVLEAAPGLKIVYLIVFLFLSFSYLAAKIFTRSLPKKIYDILLWCGSFWFAFMLYFFLFIFSFDIIRLINTFLNFLPNFITANYLLTKEITGLAVVLFVLVIVVAGFFNTRHVNIKTLNIKLNREKSKLTKLNAVLVSDIHLSPMDNEKFLSNIVDKINGLNPEIILIAGDLFDDKAEILNERSIGPSLLKLKAKYGIFACTGNHEFINSVEPAVKFMENYKIKVLRDEHVKIDDSFYLVGREDGAKKQFTGENRKPLEDIVSGLDSELPVILLDHTPWKLEQAEKNNISLQLSGHTHHGQIFPANWITSLIYEVSWGYKQKGNTQYYVSCGAGTWGPPVRLGSKSEIINLNIEFVN
jgi:uncharacterized protein